MMMPGGRYQQEPRAMGGDEQLRAAGGHGHDEEEADGPHAKKLCKSRSKPIMQALSEGRTNMQALFVRYLFHGLLHHGVIIKDVSQDGRGNLRCMITEKCLLDLLARGLAQAGFADMARDVASQESGVGLAATKLIRQMVNDMNDSNGAGSSSRGQGLSGYRVVDNANELVEAAIRDLRGLDGSVLLDPGLPRSAHQAGSTQQLHAAREAQLQQLHAARVAELQQMIAARDEEVRQVEARKAELQRAATSAKSDLEALGAAPGQMFPRNAHVLDSMLDNLEAARRRVVAARAAVPVITCPICEEEDRPQGAWDCESGHMACRACLQGWLDQQGGPGRATCHMCSQPVTSFRNVTIS